MLVLGVFSTGVFQHQCIPRINIGAETPMHYHDDDDDVFYFINIGVYVWGESNIMTGVY